MGESKVPDGRLEAHNSETGVYCGAGSTRFALAVAGYDVGGLGVEPLAAIAREEFNDGVAELTKRFDVYVAQVCFTTSASNLNHVQWVRGFFKQFSIPEVAHLEWCVGNPNSSSVPQNDAETDLREWAKIAEQNRNKVAQISEIVNSEKAVPASLISDVRGYAAEAHHGQDHVARWNRVLKAFGEQVPGFGGSPMTAAQAQQNAQTFWSVRWDPVTDALGALQAQPAPETNTEETSNNPPPPPSPAPVVSVAAGSDITEGGNAVFTVSASPAPSAALAVNVNVTVSGDYGVTAGSQTVTIPTSGSATLSITTTGDSTDETNGTVTAMIAAATAYDVSSTAGSATVNIADDDNPPPPSSDLPAFQISDGVYTEGDIYGYYLFYVTLNKPADKPVRVRYAFEPTGTGTGHATAGRDYRPISRTMYFRAGVTQNAGILVITDDNLKEPDETLRITLTSLNPQTAITADRNTSTATITIKDND